LNQVLDWLEDQRGRRIRTARTVALRGRAFDFVKRWTSVVVKGTMLLVLGGGVAIGGVLLARKLMPPTEAPTEVLGPAPGVRRVSASSPSATATPASRSRESAGDVTRPATHTVAKAVPVIFNLKAERDSMRAAFTQGLVVQRSGQKGTAWFRRAYVHATRIIERGEAGSRDFTAERLIRARSCVLGGLQCPRAAVSEDLTWVLVFGDDAQRRTAVRLLERIGA